MQFVYKAAEMRHKHASMCDMLFKLFNVALIVLTFFWFIFGIQFAAIDVIDAKHSKVMDRITFAGLFVFLHSIIICGIGVSGIRLTQRNTPQTCYSVTYGSLLFFIVIVPLLGQGGALLRIRRIEVAELEAACNLSYSDLDALRSKNDGFSRRVRNSIEYMIVYFAHELDMHSQLLLDEYMCSDVCPCYYDPEQVPNPKEEYF